MEIANGLRNAASAPSPRAIGIMPAVIATRYNAPLRTIYLALYEGGKPWKVAITAVMRKLIILANALIRDNRKWAEIAP